ncbi:hypothetical protein [Dyadobacter psychrotolerans]|nr:hypothetical protein [Dyadobacter psychrotolerans]
MKKQHKLSFTTTVVRNFSEKIWANQIIKNSKTATTTSGTTCTIPGAH